MSIQKALLFFDDTLFLEEVHKLSLILDIKRMSKSMKELGYDVECYKGILNDQKLIPVKSQADQSLGKF